MTRAWNARASPARDRANTGAPQPSTPTAATGSPARSSIVLADRQLERVAGVGVAARGPARPPRRWPASPRACRNSSCAPGQGRRRRAGYSCWNTSSRGSARGHCRSSSVSPAPARISRTPATWKSSPEWLAAASAEQLAVEIQTAAQHPGGLHRLVRRAREHGHVPLAGGQLRRPVGSDYPQRNVVPSTRRTPTGQPRRAMGGSVTAAHPKHLTGLVRLQRRPLGQPGQGGGALDEFGVARPRAAPGERGGVLHADPQVAAGAPARPAAPAASSGRSRWPTTWRPRAARPRPRPARPRCPACRPGTPITRSQCTWPPCGGPSSSSSRCSVATCPRSNSSNSGTTPAAWVRA